MYLFMFPGDSIELSSTCDDDDIHASNVGYVEIIDVTGDIPLVLTRHGWEEMKISDD